jgi:hypothetical protein
MLRCSASGRERGFMCTPTTAILSSMLFCMDPMAEWRF